MFNQLTPAAVVTAVGATLRGAATSEDRASDFERDQLLSAYSATRHLAVELERFAPVLERYTTDVLAAIRSAADDDDALAPDLSGFADRIAEDPSPAGLGAAVSELLARLHEAPTPAAAALVREVRALTRGLADDEVDLLADGLARR